MYYIQRWPKGDIFAPEKIETVLRHDVKAIAQILSNIAESFGGRYHSRVISQSALAREGKQAVQKAESDLLINKELQEKLWLALRNSSAFDPLYKATQAANNLENATMIAGDEIHRAVKDGHPLRTVGDSIGLSHERVRQIYKGAETRLDELTARCVNGHQWSAYKYYFGIAPEECIICNAVFSDLESSFNKPAFVLSQAPKHKSTAELVPIKEIIAEKDKTALVQLKDGSYRMVIKTAGFPLSKWEQKNEHEIDAVLGLWEELLNSLDFPIQVLAHSSNQVKDKVGDSAGVKEDKTGITNSLTQVQTMMDDLQDKMTQPQSMSYERQFYIVVGYGDDLKPIEDKQIVKDMFKSLLRPAKDELIEVDCNVASVNLEMRSTQVQMYLDKMGLKNHICDETELTQLYYEMFHPTKESNNE